MRSVDSEEPENLWKMFQPCASFCFLHMHLMALSPDRTDSLCLNLEVISYVILKNLLRDKEIWRTQE